MVTFMLAMCMFNMYTIYSGTSLKGLSELRTQYRKPLYNSKNDQEMAGPKVTILKRFYCITHQLPMDQPLKGQLDIVSFPDHFSAPLRRNVGGSIRLLRVSDVIHGNNGNQES